MNRIRKPYYVTKFEGAHSKGRTLHMWPTNPFLLRFGFRFARKFYGKWHWPHVDFRVNVGKYEVSFSNPDGEHNF